MIPYFSIESFRFGPLVVHTWGLFVGLAFLTGYFLSVRAGKKIGIPARKILALIILTYLGALIGARLFYCLQWPADFLANPMQFFRISDGGMIFYGGFFGGIAVGWLYLKRWQNRWQFVDAIIPIVPLSMAIGRIGCFLLNDHMGAMTTVPWAILWRDGTLRHPVALYLILFDLALAVGLWWLNKAPPFSKGRTGGILDQELNPPQPSFAKGGHRSFLLFLFLYSLGRFLLGFTRDASVDPRFWGLASSQWVSLALLIIVSSRAILKRLKNKRVSLKNIGS